PRPLDEGGSRVLTRKYPQRLSRWERSKHMPGWTPMPNRLHTLHIPAGDSRFSERAGRLAPTPTAPPRGDGYRSTGAEGTVPPARGPINGAGTHRSTHVTPAPPPPPSHRTAGGAFLPRAVPSRDRARHRATHTLGWDTGTTGSGAGPVATGRRGARPEPPVHA